MNAVQEIFAELNYPSVGVLKQALRSRAIPFDNKDLEALVSGETARQVQAPRYRFTGKIAASDLNARLFADLIDFTAAPSDGGKKVGLKPTDDNERYILVVQRVFDRKLWTKALTNKRPETVAEAFKEILDSIGEKPRSCTTDQGAEFGEPFRRLMDQEGIIVHTKQKHDINAIATVDVAIGYLKRALARVARKRKTDDWADILADVTKGQNAVPNSNYLEGNAPKDVAGNDELRKRLRKKNLEFAQHNQEESEARGKVLEAAGQFRVMLDTGGRFTRGFKPKWSEKIYKLDRVDGAFVFDTDGNSHLTKFTLPVQGNTEELQPRRFEQGGSAQTEERKRRLLDDTATEVRKWIGARTVTLSQIGTFLARRNFRALTLEARLGTKAPVANFLRVFPDTFALTIDGTGRSYVRVLSAAPAFEGAVRLRRRYNVNAQ